MPNAKFRTNRLLISPPPKYVPCFIVPNKKRPKFESQAFFCLYRYCCYGIRSVCQLSCPLWAPPSAFEGYITLKLCISDTTSPMKTQISCLFGRESYIAGGVVIVCLRIPSDSVSCDSVLLAQVNGYINLDLKWVKAADCTSTFFVQTPEIPLDQNVQMPVTNVANSHCIFITPKEILPMHQVIQDGVFLMFNLPSSLIPSYKGLSGTVRYYITLTLQSHGNNNKQLRFPFTVLGNGSNTVPHGIK